MPYDALTDRVLPYHLDGTVAKHFTEAGVITKTFSAAELLEMNDEDYVRVSFSNIEAYIVFFFPELVDISKFFILMDGAGTQNKIPTDLKFSTDTTNGFDGTWTAAVLPSGWNGSASNLDSWRTGMVPVSNIAGANAIRFHVSTAGLGDDIWGAFMVHLYGHKTAGQTPNDILFLDAEAADAELTIPLDFGDVPTASSEQRIIKIQNASATLTASTIVLTVVDPDDQIRIGLSDTGPWLTEQTVASLAPSAKSVSLYIKCEPPAAPTPLGPNRAPIKVNVGSWA